MSGVAKIAFDTTIAISGIAKIAFETKIAILAMSTAIDTYRKYLACSSDSI
ncbi:MULTISPECIES: hypothetical protein [Calothrix]|uniref:Uncharacterized protein n=2 Tax=Calothrix TaxID=1186 RepID=A0ABR8AFS8_9CYAN|nr:MULTISPECIES: hypothetical protein [Calothrix]MBD2197407.1 hypothetical protein [Calothrix parietina FACHB-288]MBD2225974.1 hypothetical protein [Calothrix anomala FACHB-343]